MEIVQERLEREFDMDLWSAHLDSRSVSLKTEEIRQFVGFHCGNLQQYRVSEHR